MTPNIESKHNECLLLLAIWASTKNIEGISQFFCGFLFFIYFKYQNINFIELGHKIPDFEGIFESWLQILHSQDPLKQMFV